MYQISVNCNIHLGFKMKEKSTRDLTYVQEISPNVVFGVSRVKGGRLSFLRIKDSNLMGYGERKSVLAMSVARWQATATRFKDTGTRL